MQQISETYSTKIRGDNTLPWSTPQLVNLSTCQLVTPVTSFLIMNTVCVQKFENNSILNLNNFTQKVCND